MTKQYHGMSWGAGALGRHSREDKELLKRVREARQRMGSELVSIGGQARFIDPAKIEIQAAA